MPTYMYRCALCSVEFTRLVKMELRHGQCCPRCAGPAQLMPSAPYTRVAGEPVQGGGPDRFTADMLGIPLKDLPESLKANRKEGD